jgi:hypothetical protein
MAVESPWLGVSAEQLFLGKLQIVSTGDSESRCTSGLKVADNEYDLRFLSPPPWGTGLWSGLVNWTFDAFIILEEYSDAAFCCCIVG